MLCLLDYRITEQLRLDEVFGDHPVQFPLLKQGQQSWLLRAGFWTSPRKKPPQPLWTPVPLFSGNISIRLLGFFHLE